MRRCETYAVHDDDRDNRVVGCCCDTRIYRFSVFLRDFATCRFEANKKLLNTFYGRARERCNYLNSGIHCSYVLPFLSLSLFSATLLRDIKRPTEKSNLAWHVSISATHVNDYSSHKNIAFQVYCAPLSLPYAHIGAYTHTRSG